MKMLTQKIPMTAINKARRADAAVRVDGEPLTDEQRREGVRLIFGADPILLLAAVTDASFRPASKVMMDAELQVRALSVIHDRTFPMPERRVKPGNDNQFELEFMWSTPEGGERVAIAQFEKVEGEQ